jgi:predicted transcriptional regulator
VPKGRRFIKWTKKIDMPKEQKELLEMITTTYNLSKREAMLYKKLLTITAKRGIIKTENVTKNFFD